MRIDLHTHSTASDGTERPAEVIAAAARAGLDVVALTDHDTTRGWAEAAEAAVTHDIMLVRGMEVSCSRDGVSVHLLAYLPDPTNAALTAELERARESRVTRLERMVEKLAADGIPVTMEDVRSQVAIGATLGRPHIADALVASGVVADRNEAFGNLLHNRSRYYVTHYAPDPVDAVRIVRWAGGVPVVAHPFAVSRGRTASESTIEEMAAAGLAGLEAHHRDHDAGARQRAVALADRLGIFVTGSSDYHGTGKENRLGENLTDPGVLAQIEEQASGVEVIRP